MHAPFVTVVPLDRQQPEAKLQLKVVPPNKAPLGNVDTSSYSKT